MSIYRRGRRWLLAGLVAVYVLRLVWLAVDTLSYPRLALAQGEPTPTRAPIIRVTAGPPPGSAPQPVVTVTSGVPAGQPPAGPGGQPGQRPGGQQPGAPVGQPPAAPVGQQPTATVLAPPGTGSRPYPGQPQPPAPAPGVVLTPRPGQAATQVAPATATPLTGGAPVPAGTAAVPAVPTAPLGALQTLSGVIVAVDALVDAPAVVIRVEGGRGTITVNPGPNTVITRNGQTATLSMLDLGDRVTVLIDQQERPLRLTVTTQPESDMTQVIWEMLLGLVMMGVVLIIDQDLRIKFMAALLEPTVEYSVRQR